MQCTTPVHTSQSLLEAIKLKQGHLSIVLGSYQMFSDSLIIISRKYNIEKHAHSNNF